MPNRLSVEITTIRKVEPKRDGFLRRNWLEIDVIVNGAAHTIRVRRESGAIKCAELHHRVDWPEIRDLVVKYLTETFFEPALQRMKALHAARQQ